ncbi:MAG: 6-carboxytetrahydropterin synthase QueD [Acidobacteriota bacterium]
MYEVSVDQTFAAAHALRHYKGSCENLHGHNFRVQVTFEGEKLDQAGMLIDFLDVRDMMQQILSRLDHQNLNEVAPFDVTNPSAENIAEYFHIHLTTGLANLTVPVRVSAVKVWETEIQSATYRPNA